MPVGGYPRCHHRPRVTVCLTSSWCAVLQYLRHYGITANWSGLLDADDQGHRPDHAGIEPVVPHTAPARRKITIQGIDISCPSRAGPGGPTTCGRPCGVGHGHVTPTPKPSTRADPLRAG